jgi:hypothetical protein
LYKVERFHTPGTSGSERLKVTALNLFHPTASPPLPKNRFFHIATQSPRGEENISCYFLSNFIRLIVI